MSTYRNTIYVPAAKVDTSTTQSASHYGRIKFGDIFIIQDNVFELVCLHCSQGFHDFDNFTAHVHEHLLGIGSMLSQPTKLSKRNVHTEYTTHVKEDINEIDSGDIFANIDMDMVENYDDGDMASASESDACGDNDDASINHIDTDQSISGIDKDIVRRLAKENFKLDDSSEAEEYSRYLYDYQFRNVNGFFGCPKCNRKTKQQNHMKRHIFSHLQRKIFTCTICNIKLSNPLHTREHNRFHQEEKSRKRVHPTTHTIENDSVGYEENDQFREVKSKLRANGIAMKNTRDTVEYLEYLCGQKRIEKENGKFVCPKCTYSSEHPNHVKRHVATHFRMKMFSCLKCLKKIGNIENCRKHMNFIHGMQMERISFSANAEEDDSVDGESCRKSNKISLRKCDSNKSIQCEVCGMTVQKRNTEEHMTTHNQENVEENSNC